MIVIRIFGVIGEKTFKNVLMLEHVVLFKHKICVLKNLNVLFMGENA
jgi:hypothetical protein